MLHFDYMTWTAEGFASNFEGDRVINFGAKWNGFQLITVELGVLLDTMNK